jgi:hypothetical protein
MGCTDGIVKTITSDCTTAPNGGLEVTMYAFNRLNYTVTYDGTSGCKITGIDRVGEALAYKIKGVKKLFNAGHDAVIADDRPTKWTHFVSFEMFERLAADTINGDNLNDLFIVVEIKDKSTTGEGVFIGYGIKKGLFLATDTRRANDANGARKIELKSLSGQEEPYSEYTVFVTSYAATFAYLEALCVAVP